MVDMGDMEAVEELCDIDHEKVEYILSHLDELKAKYPEVNN